MHKQVFKKGHNSVRKGPTKNSSLNPQHTMDDNHRKSSRLSTENCWKEFANGWKDRWTDVPTLHIVSYFAGRDTFMSLHKLIITLFLSPKKTFYEFFNSFYAIYKPISSKCGLGWTAFAIT